MFRNGPFPTLIVWPVFASLASEELSSCAAYHGWFPAISSCTNGEHPQNEQNQVSVLELA